MTHIEPSDEPAMGRITRFVVILLSTVGIVMSIFQTLPIIPPGMRPLTSAVYYALLGIFLAVAYLTYPGDRQNRSKYLNALDWVLALTALVVGIWFAFLSRKALTAGWAGASSS